MVAWESGNNTLMISSSWFRNEMDQRSPVMAPIIDVVCGRAIIQGNWFEHNNGGDAVRVGPEVVAAMINGNLAENQLAFPRTRTTQTPPCIVDSGNMLFSFYPLNRTGLTLGHLQPSPQQCSRSLWGLRTPSDFKHGEPKRHGL